jgi:hypothetical protein
MQNKLIFSVIACLVSLVFSFQAMAATVFTSAYVTSTSNEVNEGANHEFVLVPSAAIPEGDTLSLAFDDEFDTSSIVEDDVDILDDGDQLTTATDCSGSEEASVSISSDVISVAICAGDGGAIASGSTVRVRIGTNATSSGTGSNQIINPNRSVSDFNQQGTVYIDIATSTNNLAATVPYPLVTVGGESITATTPDPGVVDPPDPPDPPNPPNPPDPNEYTISLTYPVGGEEFNYGNAVDIEWTSLDDAFAFVNIRYQVEGQDPVPIAENILNQYTYEWTVPDITSDSVIIIVEATDLVEILDTDASSEFSVIGSPSPEVSVLTPNGGEVYVQGESIEVDWFASDLDSYDIAFSSNGGADYEVLATGLADLSFDWIVPDVVTSQGLIRVTGYHSEGEVLDESDAFFSIEEGLNPAVAVISPNGGEEFQVNEDFAVSWAHSDVMENLIVEVSLDAGETWAQLDAAVPTSSLSLVTSLSEPTNEALIRVRNAGGTLSDTSDAFFSIINVEESPQDPEWDIEFTSPNNGASLTRGQDYTLQWNAFGPNDGFNLLRFIGAEESILAAGFTGSSFEVSPQSLGALSYRVELVYENQIRATDSITFTVIDEDDVESPEPPVDPEEPGDPDEPGEPDEPNEPADPAIGDIDVSLKLPGADYFLPEFTGDVYVLPGTTLELVVRQPDGSSADVVIDGRQNQIKLVDGVGSLLLGVSGDENIQVIGNSNGEVIIDSLQTTAQPYGSISGEGLDDAVVFAFLEGAQWNAGAYGQTNPLLALDGSFAWYAPVDTYELFVSADGFEEFSESVRASRGILRSDISLIPSPLQAEEDSENSINPGLAVVREVQDLTRAIREEPTAQVVADISIPVLGAATAASAIVLVSSFQALPLAQYIFTFPILLFYRRKRRQFGTVYHSVTKVPIPLAYVRLKTSAGKLVRTVVSDTKGRFYLSAKPGVYQIDVRKPQFTFPSEFLSEKKSDGDYLDLYTGGEIVIEEDDVLSMNIPLDPAGGQYTLPKRVLLKRILRALQWVIAVSGLLLALYVVIVYPNAFTFAALGLQVALLLLTRVLIKPHKKRGWGVVVDATSGKPLKNAIVRLFEPKFNKLIETQITDAKGRYVFIAGPNTYYLKASKDGYVEGTVNDIDYSENKVPKPIDEQVKLKKSNRSTKVEKSKGTF